MYKIATYEGGLNSQSKDQCYSVHALHVFMFFGFSCINYLVRKTQYFFVTYLHLVMGMYKNVYKLSLVYNSCIIACKMS